MILLMSAATNYQQSMDEKFDYFSDEDPLTTVKRTLMAAESKTYEDLLSSHKKDYKALYDRMSLNLGNMTGMPTKTTDILLKNFYKRQYC